MKLGGRVCRKPSVLQSWETKSTLAFGRVPPYDIGGMVPRVDLDFVYCKLGTGGLYTQSEPL